MITKGDVEAHAAAQEDDEAEDTSEETEGEEEATEASEEAVGAILGGYHSTDWMALFGGVPTEEQIDGYLAKISASTAQKNAVRDARAKFGHQMTLAHIESILTDIT